MADKFVGTVDAPNMRFGSDQFVDTSNPLELLPQAAKSLEAATGNLALKQAQNLFLAEEQAQTDYYTKARESKQGLWQAAVDGDEAAVKQYSDKIMDLKIAEKQGLISGVNSQIRQETLLRQTINRFPHREEQIRRLYSSVRDRAQAEREQFKDPIEEGIDQMVSRAFAAGRTPAQQIDFERAADAYTVFKQNAEMRATMGQDLQNDFSEMIDKRFSTMAFAEVSNWLNMARSTFEQDKTFTIEMAKGQYEQLKHQVLMSYQRTVNDIVRNSPNPDAVLNRDFVVSKRAEVVKMLDDMASQITSMDDLVARQRMMEWGKQLGYEKLMQYDPLIAWMVTSNPEKGAAFVFEDWDATERILKTQGVSEFNVLVQNATGAEKTRLQFQRDMILGWNGLSKQEYFNEIYNNGSVPDSTGIPEVDAARVNAVVSTALNSRNATPEMKTNSAKAALQAEKVYSKPGEYLAPSAVWYKDPGRRNALRSDPQFQAQMDTEITNSAATVLSKMDPEVLDSISFLPQMEQEPVQNPWSIYQNGGPFSTPAHSGVELAKRSKFGDRGMSQERNKVMDTGVYIQSLNSMYWIKRIMEGPAAAEMWAGTVLDEAKTAISELAGEEGEVPTFDLTD